MQTIKSEVRHAGATLALLRNLIHNQRQALQHFPGADLEPQLAAWEEIIQRLQQETALEHSMRLGLLYEASQKLNSSLDWQETVENVIDAVIRITGAERGLLMLHEQGTWRVLSARCADNHTFSDKDLQFSHSIIQQMAEQGKAILTHNAQRDPRFRSSDSIVTYGLRSILCAPLSFRGELLGALYLENRMKAGIFSQDDLITLSAFANQAATALANARTHQQTQQALARSAGELQVLQDMARDLNTRLDYEHVMARSVYWLVTAVKAQAGALALLAEEGLRWTARLGEAQPNDTGAWQMLRQRRAEVTPEQLLVPILREGRPLGIFWLQAGAEPFTEKELAFAMRLADSAAMAIENARLYEALVQANQAKNEFISLVSHELRTPMTSIRGYTDMLQKGIVGELNPQQVEFLEAISRNVERMRILVSDLLDISRIESGRLRLKLQALPLTQALEEALRVVQEPLESKQQLLITDLAPDLPNVYADPDRLTQIFINLLGNAIKYTPARGTIAVQARLHPHEPGVIHCTVMDNGVGISPEDQQRLFTKFFRSENPAIREQTGTGLGLAITKNLVEMHGGSIWVESKLEKGSSFHFTLPRAPATETAAN